MTESAPASGMPRAPAAATTAAGTIAAIIAGGAATRLGGRPKGLVEIGGRRIVDRQLEALGQAFPRVVLVANDPTPWQGLRLRIVPDRGGPGRGPLAGLDAALAALAPDEHAVVCVAGDLPFLAPALLDLLRDVAPGADAVVPRLGTPSGPRPEPLCARYGRACAAPIAAALAAGRLKAAAVVEELGPRWLLEDELRRADPELRSFLNVNTPEDVARAEALTG